MSRWWRAEDTSIDHPKLLKLSDAMHRAWYTLMCVASANDGALPPAEDIAVRLRMNKAKVAEWIAKLVAAELFDNVDGVFVPHNWNKRQYKTDGTDPTNAVRQKRYRDRRRNGVTAVTGNDGNGVTPKRPEAEADTEAETEQSRADAPAPIDEDLKRRAQALWAGISAHFLARKFPVPADMRRCEHWLTQGYSSGTVLAAVETVLKRGRPVGTLEYFDGAIADQHGHQPAASPELQVVSSKVVVIEGTLEHTCWNQYRAANGMRPLFICRQAGPENTIVMGALCDSLFPPGYDEATGEKLQPKSDEAAA